ncbi:MotA/TolQ/ExbB proton channel family protein [Myxococcota bacterium]|nr:MotA/TolQ/ExbB proton channel family protein [Myxococcota bacterium]
MAVFELLKDGGFMMFVLLGVSLVAAIITLDRAFHLWIKARINVQDFIGQTIAHIESDDYKTAIEACDIATTHPLPTVLKAGLGKANRREREIERAMERQMLNAMPGMQRGVGFLGLLGNVATLLGLLGTIFGLIQAFSGLGAANAAERQKVLSDGISVAMYTTAFGLIVAVPILFAHTLISGRIDKLLIEIEEGASAILGALAGRMGLPKKDSGS